MYYLLSFDNVFNNTRLLTICQQLFYSLFRRLLYHLTTVKYTTLSSSFRQLLFLNYFSLCMIYSFKWD